jgi:hypothetical protein
MRGSDTTQAKVFAVTIGISGNYLSTISGMRSELLAFLASGVGGGLKLAFARIALTRRRFAPNMVAHRASLLH